MFGAVAGFGLPEWTLVFLVSGAVIVVAGTVLARAGDGIARVTGLGGLFVGVILLAVATSLPEMLTNVAAAAAGSPDLAVGDLFGANMATMGALAIVDLLHRGRVWPSVRLGQALVASVAIMLTTLAVLAILVPSGLGIGWIGLDTIAIACAYVAAAAWLRRSGSRRERRAGRSGEIIAPIGFTDGEPTASRGSRRSLVLRFVGATGAIVLAAPLLALSGQGVAAATGIGETFIGTTMLAAATSLPELVTAVAAVRIGAHDLAVGNLFGSAAFNMAILVIADAAYTPGPILAAVAPSQVVAGVGAVLLMSIALAAIVHGERTRASRLEPDALVLLGAYILALIAVWVAGS